LPLLRDITAGDNWHYNAHGGYDQATGLGVPDVANLLKACADAIVEPVQGGFRVADAATARAAYRRAVRRAC
jgi:hypothetical protein